MTTAHTFCRAASANVTYEGMSAMIRTRALFVALSCVMFASSENLRAQSHDEASPWANAPLTILQLNDVYTTVPIDGVGGLARVATLKHELAASGATPFMMLAGDFLSSSVESTIFKGEQMVATLNAAGVDLATLGNHEFDFGNEVLMQRMREANVNGWYRTSSTATGQPVGGARRTSSRDSER